MKTSTYSFEAEVKGSGKKSVAVLTKTRDDFNRRMEAFNKKATLARDLQKLLPESVPTPAPAATGGRYLSVATPSGNTLNVMVITPPAPGGVQGNMMDAGSIVNQAPLMQSNITAAGMPGNMMAARSIPVAVQGNMMAALSTPSQASLGIQGNMLAALSTPSQASAGIQGNRMAVRSILPQVPGGSGGNVVVLRPPLPQVPVGSRGNVVTARYLPHLAASANSAGSVTTNNPEIPLVVIDDDSPQKKRPKTE